MCISCTEQCTNGAGSPWYEDVHIKQASNRHERGSKLNKLEQDGNHEPECSHVILRWTGHNQILVRLSAFFVYAAMPSTSLYNTSSQLSCQTLFSATYLYASLQHSSPTRLYNTLLQHFPVQHFSGTLFSSTSLQLLVALLYNTSLQLYCEKLFSAPYLQRFSTTLLPNSYLQHFSLTPFSKTSPQHSSPTRLYNTLFQRFSTTLFPNTSLQHSSPTPPYNTSPALFYNTVLQHFSPTLFSNTSPQHFSTTLRSTTFLQNSSPTLPYNDSLQHQLPNDLYNTSPQHFSTALPSNTLLQHFSTTLSPTLPYNVSIQHSSPALLYNNVIQHFSTTPSTSPKLNTSRAGQAGGGSFKRKKNYKPQKEFESFVTNLIPCLAPFSDDSNKVGICWLCHSSNCTRQPVLDDAKSLPSCGRSQSATTCGSSYAPKNTQRYSVLQSATKYCSALTNYCKSITPYNKALLQYYSVLQSTTPVLFRIQSTTPALLCTTKIHSSTTLYYKVPLRTTPVELYYKLLQSIYYSGTTLYYKVTLMIRDCSFCHI